MKRFLTSLVWILLVAFPGCQKDQVYSYLDSVAADSYYSDEIIPSDYRKIYGEWQLYKISGGFSGDGYTPDFDYLDIKPIGIYGLVRNDILFESGKIEPFMFDSASSGFLQVKLIPVYSSGNPSMYPPEKYLHLRGTDSLDLISPCCDMYNYHFRRVR
jgi:hypothetical protein